MPLKSNGFSDTRFVEYGSKPFVTCGYLCMGMRVGGSGDRNLKFYCRSQNRGVRVLFADGLSPSGRARFHRQARFVRDLEDRAKSPGRIISVG